MKAIVLRELGEAENLGFGGGVSSFALAIAKKLGARVFVTSGYSATTGLPKEIDLRRIFWNQINILGSTMGTAQDFEQMLSLYSNGGLQPLIDQVFPLAEAPAAHRRMEEAEQFGKIVLRID